MVFPDTQEILDLIEGGTPEEALLTLKELAERLPSYAALHVLLARACEAAGKWADAHAAWQHAAFLIPNSPAAREGLERTRPAPLFHSIVSTAPDLNLDALGDFDLDAPLLDLAFDDDTASVDVEEPEIPDEPETPVIPGEPEIPEAPAEPETPETPEIPDEPETPEIPDEPELPGAFVETRAPAGAGETVVFPFADLDLDADPVVFAPESLAEVPDDALDALIVDTPDTPAETKSFELDALDFEAVLDAYLATLDIQEIHDITEALDAEDALGGVDTLGEDAGPLLYEETAPAPSETGVDEVLNQVEAALAAARADEMADEATDEAEGDADEAWDDLVAALADLADATSDEPDAPPEPPDDHPLDPPEAEVSIYEQIEQLIAERRHAPDEAPRGEQPTGEEQAVDEPTGIEMPAAETAAPAVVDLEFEDLVLEDLVLEIEEDEPTAVEEPGVDDVFDDLDAEGPLHSPDSLDTLDDLDRLIDELEAAHILPDPNLDNLPAPDLDDEIDDVVSETLARIYTAQRQYHEAARVYDELARQQPGRADHFLARAAEMRSMAAERGDAPTARERDDD